MEAVTVLMHEERRDEACPRAQAFVFDLLATRGFKPITRPRAHTRLRSTATSRRVPVAELVRQLPEAGSELQAQERIALHGVVQRLHELLGGWRGGFLQQPASLLVQIGEDAPRLVVVAATEVGACG